VRTLTRPPIWVSAAGVGGLQLIGSFGAAANQPDRRGIDAVALVLLLAGPVALAVRERWPLPAVAVSVIAVDVYIGLGYAYGPVVASPVVAMITAIVLGRRHGTWLLAGIGYAGCVLAFWLDPRARHDSLLAVLGVIVVWLALVLSVGELIRARRDSIRQRAQAEAARRERSDSEQRLALAQELHDVLAHHISLINVQAGVALHLIDEQPERARPALAEIKEASREALRELRGALDVLRRGQAAPRAPAPGLADLPQLVATVAASGLDVRLRALPDRSGDRVPAAVQLATYRIVQESLTNVARHAHASCATVRLGYAAPSDEAPVHGRAADELTVEVLDDGVGGSPVPGNGISGMRERAEALGGHVQAGPHPDGGFAVRARLPVGTP